MVTYPPRLVDNVDKVDTLSLFIWIRLYQHLLEGRLFLNAVDKVVDMFHILYIGYYLYLPF